MAYEWGRFVWWLNQNAGAVQAMAAVATVVLTAALILVTIRYVSLTAKLLEASEASARANFLPDIESVIDFTHPRRGELEIALTNVSDTPIRVVRARFLGGTIFKWATASSPPNEYASQAQLQPTPINTLKSAFLRKGETASGKFIITPVDPVENGAWLAFIDFRISLHVGAVIEVSDIGGRNTFSFTVLRNVHRGSTSIALRSPSLYESAALSDYYSPPDLAIPPAFI
jgi:hypothetical protein